MIELPRELEDFVAGRLEAADLRAIAVAAVDLSQRYRALAPSRLDSLEGVLAYAAWMLPATHAQVLGALRAVPLRVGEWRPRSLLDLGGGPGTAAWAALDIWPDIESVTVVDREPAMLDFGREAAAGAPFAALRDAKWLSAGLPGGIPRGQSSLVILANVVGELDPTEAALVVRRAWEACDGALVIVEPGTPPGFRAVEEARRLAIGLGAHVLAPCPHAGACPLSDLAILQAGRAHGAVGRKGSEEGFTPDERGNLRVPPGRVPPGRVPPAPDWCHFSERHERPGFQRRVKDASLPWEDAKVSFVVLSRFESGAAPWARVLRHPWHGKGHARFRLCTEEGVVERTVARSAGAGWRLARKLEWGSAVEREEDLGG